MIDEHDIIFIQQMTSLVKKARILLIDEIYVFQI